MICAAINQIYKLFHILPCECNKVESAFSAKLGFLLIWIIWFMSEVQFFMKEIKKKKKKAQNNIKTKKIFEHKTISAAQRPE